MAILSVILDLVFLLLEFLGEIGTVRCGGGLFLFGGRFLGENQCDSQNLSKSVCFSVI